MSGASPILPDFASILLGALLGRLAAFGVEFWRGLERLVYFVLFPALPFVSIARAPFDDGARRFLAVGVLATLAGAALGYLAKPCMRLEPRAFASAVQCAFRFHSFLALAPAAALGGPAGLAQVGMLIGCAVPVRNLLSVWGLARAGEASVA